MLKKLFAIIPLALFVPAMAHANVGIPVVSFGLPFMAANLILVVLIEAFVIKRLYPKLDNFSVAKSVLFANLITTLIGYPLIGVLEAMTPIILDTNSSLGWILPYENLNEMNVYISTMMFLTLIPCYFLSVWIEGLWLRRRLSAEISWKNIVLAHLFSYLFLTVQVCANLPVLYFNKHTFDATCDLLGYLHNLIL